MLSCGKYVSRVQPISVKGVLKSWSHTIGQMLGKAHDPTHAPSDRLERDMRPPAHVYCGSPEVKWSVENALMPEASLDVDDVAALFLAPLRRRDASSVHAVARV